jgi:hypothetical protein
MGLFYKILIIIFFIFNFTIECDSIYCGSERSDVKHFSDKDAVLVNIKPTEISVDSFLLLDRIHLNPAFSHKHIARLEDEKQVYTIECYVKFFMLEKDNDYHLICCDSNYKIKFIAEIPSPECSESIQSGYAAQYKAARNLLDSLYPEYYMQKHYTKYKFPLKITGVLFHDFVHGQTGHAPNGIELHPVFFINY